MLLLRTRLLVSRIPGEVARALSSAIMATCEEEGNQATLVLFLKPD